MTTTFPSQKLLVVIFNHPDIQVLNTGARNSSPSVMEGLVCLYLEAAPGYISLAVSAHPRPPATIASPLHTLFHTVPSSPSLSQRLRILDKSRGLGYNPLVCEGPRSSLSLKRPLHLYYHCATRFFYLIPFTHLLLTLDSSGVLPTFAIDYDPLVS
jgi:hypothetical protein